MGAYMEPNSMPESSKLNAKTCSETHCEHYQKSWISLCKIMQIKLKTKCFEGCAGCVRKRNSYQKNVANKYQY